MASLRMACVALRIKEYDLIHSRTCSLYRSPTNCKCLFTSRQTAIGDIAHAKVITSTCSTAVHCPLPTTHYPRSAAVPGGVTLRVFVIHSWTAFAHLRFRVNPVIRYKSIDPAEMSQTVLKVYSQSPARQFSSRFQRVLRTSHRFTFGSYDTISNRWLPIDGNLGHLSTCVHVYFCTCVHLPSQIVMIDRYPCFD
jgi:hypothetical protein